MTIAMNHVSERYLSRLSAFLCLVIMMTGCRAGQEMLPEELSGGSRYICFSASSDGITTKALKGNGIGACFSYESEEWPVAAVGTKGLPTTAFAGSASVIAFNYNGAWTGSETPWTGFYCKEFSFNGDALTAVDNPVPWVKAQGKDNLRVYVYAPNDFGGTVSSASDPGAPTITYSVPSDVLDQEDLIVATNTVSGNYNSSIPLTFNHALTAVKFNVDFPCTVKSVAVNGVYSSGVYTIGDSWSSLSSPADYFISMGAGKDCTRSEIVTNDEKTLMLIPQAVPAGATISITFSEDGGADQTITADIGGQVWNPGSRVTYNIQKEGAQYIYFDLAAGNVVIENGAYSGYVYTYNGATLAPVTGYHASNNLYYVYQSTAANRSTTGWSEAIGSTMRLPEYAEARTSNGVSWSTSSGSKTWREFITNNTDIASVIDGWEAAAVARGTESTPNRIKISGNMTIDITLDNVWSSFHQNVRHRLSAGLLIGPGVASRGNRYERVTLRLKGDNHFHNVLYYGHPSTQTGADRAYFKITSYEGDASPFGTLTVTVPDKTMTLTGACTLFGTGDDDECPPCNDMWFYGGTIYVGSSLGIVDSDATGILGGGTNNHCNLTFNGGVVTSVAYSNGAAIGGGGGFHSSGGRGEITINAGKVYAYQFGSVSPGRHEALATAAIGGGSSYQSPGNPGVVVINGGEVYAQSIGGVALGGGTSGDIYGGQANVTITGGTVIAKSVAGDIGGNPSYHRSIPGSSIGGGTGGKSASGTGGTAFVTITGGTLLAGSIGGGGTISTSATIGSAVINISGGDVQGQFVMAAGAATTPSFTMTGGTIQNGKSGDFLFVKPDGGAVYLDDGNVTLSGGTIQNCSAVRGGAVYMTNGIFAMDGGNIKNCNANLGGAVYISGDSNPSFIMSGGEISECISASHGGAVYLEGGTVTMTDGTVRDNKSIGGNGGGFYINKGTFTMADGAITGNYAQTNGGGIYISSVDTDVSATVSGGAITDNSAEMYGGGLCVLPGSGTNASVTIGVDGQGLLNPEISENSASIEGGGIYTSGVNADIVINSGYIRDNAVNAYVDNEDVANEGGMVTLVDGDVKHQVVTFYANGSGAFFDDNGDYTQNSGETTEKIQNIVTSTNSTLVAPTTAYRMGYHFAGWNTRADGYGTSYTNGQIMNITEDVDLYIQWELD